MKKIAILLIIILYMKSVCFSQDKRNKKLIYLPTEVVPIKIVQAIWIPLYGDNILKYIPFEATLIDDKIWVVKGIHSKGFGGCPYIEMQKSDCIILNVTHVK